MSISHSPPKHRAPPCRHSSPLVDIRENKNRPHAGMISRENGSAGAADTPTLILYPHSPRSSINFLDFAAFCDKEQTTPTLILYPHSPRSSINFLDFAAFCDKPISILFLAKKSTQMGMFSRENGSTVRTVIKDNGRKQVESENYAGGWQTVQMNRLDQGCPVE